MAMQSTLEAKPLTLLVGVDFSEASDVALREAMMFFEKHPDLALHVAHVIKEPEGAVRRPKRLERDSELLAQAPERLRVYIREHGTAIPLREIKTEISLHVRIGPPAEALIQLAADVDADLLIVGKERGESRAKRLFSSCVETLLERAPCPLMIARQTNYAGVPRSARVEPPRPNSERPDSSIEDFSSRERFAFSNRSSHISGLL